MTHTNRPTDERAPSPLEERPWWRRQWLVGALAAVFLAVAIVVVALWPDGEEDVESAASTTAAPTTEAPATTTLPTTPPTTEAPATTAPPTTSATEPGTMAWATSSAPPSGQVLAVTAMDTGYLAAAHTSDGTEFWVSDAGDSWTLLATDLEAFRPNYQVYVLHSGPAGFTAEAFDPTADMSMGTNVVFASTDGATWHRTELMGDLPESPSPYLIQHSAVNGVTIGADGFLAFGSGSLMPDFDRIAAEYAPGYSSEDVWAVDAEMRPEGAVLIIGFGEENAPLEIPFTELGVPAEDLAAIFEEEGNEASAISQFLWWSADGMTWDLISPQGLPEFWLMSFVLGSVGADDGFYVFSADEGAADPEGPGVISGYFSTDGRVWSRLELVGPSGHWMHTVDYGDGLFVAVGEDESGRALWTSTDARVWERASGSEALFDLGYEGDYAIEEVDIGRAGFTAVGMVHGEEQMYPIVPVEPVVAKDGYAVTFGDDGLTIEDETTGEVEVFDMETGSSPSIQIRDGEIGLTFVDIATGETLLVITNEEIEAAWNALAEESGAMGQPPAQVFRYSTDLARWTLDTAEDLFGAGAFAVSGDMGGDTCIALAGSDIERWYEEPNRGDLPPTVIWVGTPGS